VTVCAGTSTERAPLRSRLIPRPDGRGWKDQRSTLSRIKNPLPLVAAL
jgi:hypothetical protein